MAINPSLLIVPYRYKAAKLYSQLPESGDGDFTVTRGTTATRVNASGLIESVASGVPRLDYTGGGCPSLLVEPAATNLTTYSEQFDDASWLKEQGGVALAPVVTANTATAPDGTMTADTVVFDLNGGATSSDLSQLSSIPFTHGATAHTASVYAMTSDGTTKVFSFITAGGSIAQVTIGPTWSRIMSSSTLAASSTRIRLRLRGGAEGTSTSASIYLWGAQYETGSVATSYIPTVASTVTRNADVISLSSVSGLIGQTAGTLYIDFNYNQTPSDSNGRLLQVYATNDTTNAIVPLIFGAGADLNRFKLDVWVAGSFVPAIPPSASTVVPFGRQKFAIAYSAGVYTVYRNGALFASGTGASPALLTSIDLGASSFVSRSINNGINAAAIYTSRLSNSELASLTSL